jgi:uncharacterized membrane protein
LWEAAVARGEPARTASSASLAHERVLLFSNAVFAIALMLLVVEIGVPEATGRQRGDELMRLLPKFGSHTLSFAVVCRVLGGSPAKLLLHRTLR